MYLMTQKYVMDDHIASENKPTLLILAAYSAGLYTARKAGARANTTVKTKLSQHCK